MRIHGPHSCALNVAADLKVQCVAPAAKRMLNRIHSAFQLLNEPAALSFAIDKVGNCNHFTASSLLHSGRPLADVRELARCNERGRARAYLR